MGGYGGALKQLSIGFGSSAGKSYQHSAGKTANQNVVWSNICTDKEFKEARLMPPIQLSNILGEIWLLLI